MQKTLLRNSTLTAIAAAAAAAIFASQSAQATSATWTGATDSTWAGANWSASPVPGTGNTATFNASSATVNTNTTIDLGSGVTISTLLFDTANAAAYTIGSGAVGSQTLTLNSSGAITMNSTVANNELVNAAIVLGTDATTQSYTFTNNSTSNTLTFAGGITGGSTGTAGTETLTITGAGNTAISGVIGNGGATAVALNKTGAGTLTLSGTNTYSGTTTVGVGTLKLGSAGAISSSSSLVAVSSGATLDLNGQTITTVFGNNSTTDGFAGTGVGANGALVNSSGTAATISGNIFSNQTITVGGSGDITLSGIVQRRNGGVSNVGLTFTGSGTLTLGGTASAGSTGVGVLTMSSGKVVLAKNGAGLLAAQSAVVNGGTLQFNQSLGNSTGGTFSGQLNGGVQLNSGGTFDLNGSSGGNATMQSISSSSSASGGTVTNSSGTAAALTISARDAIVQTFGGIIQDGTGGMSLSYLTTFSSGRINLLTGANTFTGSTTISGATLELGNALAVQNSTLVVNAGAGLGTNTTYGITTTNPLAFANGIGTFTIGGLSGAGNIALTDIGRTAAGVTATAASVNLQVGNNNASTTYSGVISDGTVAGGKLIKIGTGTTTLTGSNTYTGGTTIKAGTLAIVGSALNNATGAIILGDATLGANAVFTENSGGQTLTSNFTVASGSGSRTLAGNNGGGSTANYSGTVTLNNNLILNETGAATSNGTLSLNGVVSGTGNITIDGGSTGFGFTKFGNSGNNITGNIVIQNSGTLLTVNGALGSSNAVSIDSTSTLNSTGASLTIAGLNSTGTGGQVVVSSAPSSVLTLGGSGTYSYAGVINNAGGVTKSGAGSQTLSGVNTYTGATAVNGGTLVVSSTGKINGSSAITVGVSGTFQYDGLATTSTVSVDGILKGTGTLGAVTINSGGFLKPGDSPGNLTVANFSLATGTLAEEITGAGGTGNAGGTYDLLTVNGTVTLGGTLAADGTITATTNDLYFIINNDSTDAVSGLLNGVAQGGLLTLGSQQFNISYTGDFAGGTFTGGNDVVLQAVPEPSAWITLLGGLGLLVGIQRFRRPQM